MRNTHHGDPATPVSRARKFLRNKWARVAVALLGAGAISCAQQSPNPAQSKPITGEYLQAGEPPLDLTPSGSGSGRSGSNQFFVQGRPAVLTDGRPTFDEFMARRYAGEISALYLNSGAPNPEDTRVRVRFTERDERVPLTGIAVFNNGRPVTADDTEREADSLAANVLCSELEDGEITGTAQVGDAKVRVTGRITRTDPSPGRSRCQTEPGGLEGPVLNLGISGGPGRSSNR